MKEEQMSRLTQSVKSLQWRKGFLEKYGLSYLSDGKSCIYGPNDSLYSGSDG
jgi:hypothetical protein